MNKKLLILGALATALLVTACVKKESPSEDEQEKTAASQVEPADFKALEATQVQEEVTVTTDSNTQPTAPAITETQRETQQPSYTEPSNTKPVETNPTASTSNSNSSKTTVTNTAVEEKKITTTPAPQAAVNNKVQSEDDAVAAAIAAATPALKN
ncbi:MULTISPECIES: internalin [unclassified Acinetobacter]|uniref:internalin n=1 Tax=unclassified Acinetobacter TaxID=196816 RepID=UPI0029341E7D|nr:MULTISPECIES: internalin [unclassified Acinetobacter]WOE32300.1 internalin [Acinetobacter sp. SAAs470]WOE37771.1 internalin [Acinetobacter sp. SAAs474]